MKLHKWLTAEEANLLKLTVKKNEKNRKQARYYVTEDEFNLILQHRNKGIIEAHNSHNVDYQNSKILWLKNKTASIQVKNPFYRTPEEKTYQDLRDNLIADLKEYAPKFPNLKHEPLKDAQLLVIDLADLHIGKLADSFETGKDYNAQVAVDRAFKGVKGILSKAQGVNIDQILFVGGNDILHTDTPKSTTTSGTPQDSDGMWYSNFLMAKNLYVEILEMLIAVAPVHFVFNPSNHDYQNGFFLANVIEAYFRKCKDITFDCSISHRKYYRYHNNIICTTHGDGAKQDNLPILMATETSDYSECKKRYIYTHHLHHKMSKDYPGVSIETLRSPSDADSWHHRNGFQHAPVAIEGFLHHKEYGQELRITHNF